MLTVVEASRGRARCGYSMFYWKTKVFSNIVTPQTTGSPRASILELLLLTIVARLLALRHRSVGLLISF
jgi:hypothetical protein